MSIASLFRASTAARGALVLVALAAITPAPADAQQRPDGPTFGEAARALAPESRTMRGVALRRLYSARDARPLWTVGGRPTPQARAVVAVLRDAESRGLEPADYEADSLATAAASLDAAPTDDETLLARFDVSLSRAAVRMLGDLHEGRARPAAVGFHLPEAHRGLDLATLAVDASRASEPASVFRDAEPPYAGYGALEDALGRYRQMAADSSLRPPVTPRAPLRPGDRYGDASALRDLLVALGDLAASADTGAAEGDERYTPALAEGVRAFQRRHGLVDDGVVGPATRAALRVPLARRVRQMELTLERWRWLPDTAPARYAVVNVPAFRLYVFENDPRATHPELRMNVIVGQAVRQRSTPVFTGTMQQVVMRPYWDVPPSIARKETIPAIRRTPAYFDREELEIVRGGDEGAVVYPLSERNLERVLAGTLRIRQRPGPVNALGLVKFVFPNDYNVYLHGTPMQELFAQTRRDFSHGCIRVEDPTALAEFVLRGQPGWDRAGIEAAMQGEQTIRVPVARPVTVYVLYATVAVGDGGVVRFYPDLYGRDATLEQVLARTRARP